MWRVGRLHQARHLVRRAVQLVDNRCVWRLVHLGLVLSRSPVQRRQSLMHGRGRGRRECGRVEKVILVGLQARGSWFLALEIFFEVGQFGPRGRRFPARPSI